MNKILNLVLVLLLLFPAVDAGAAFTAVGSILNANHNSSSSTWSPTTSTTLNAGELAICSIAIDNLNATAAEAYSTNVVMVTDAVNNIWIKLREYTNGNSAAGAGATTALFYTKAKTQLNSGSAVNVTLSGATTAKAMTCINFTMASTKGLYIDGQGDVANDGADPGAVTVTGYNNVSHLWIRSMALETTGTSWTNTAGWTQVAAAASAGAMASAMEFKISTATSSGSSDPTYAAVDSASSLIGLIEIGDLGCGRDTNQDGTVDNWCTGLFNCVDDDADGYCTNGLGPKTGVDCDDHDFFIYPDPAVGTDSGCSGVQVKFCQADGNYTSCQNPCPSDCVGGCKYVQTVTGNDTTGDGSIGNPKKTLGVISEATSTPPGYIGLSDDQCLVVLNSDAFSDMITASGRTVGVDLSSTSNPSSGHIKRIVGAPGKWPLWTKANSLAALHDGANRWKISGFKITNNICNGYTSTACVANDYGTETEFYNIIGIGNAGADNTGLVMLSNAVNSKIHHVFGFDHTQNGQNDDNTTNFLGWRGTGNEVYDTVSTFIANTGGKEVYKVKHANYDSDWQILRFIAVGAQMQFAGRLTTLKNGLIYDTSIAFNNPGGPSFTGDELLQHLTIINNDGSFLSVAGYKDYNINNSFTSDRCTADYTISNIVFRDSIVQDGDTAYSNQDDRLMFVGTYDGDPMFIETASALSLLNSIFYNPNTAPSFGIFERNNGNTACAGYGDYGSAYSLSGLASIPKPTSGTLAIPTTGSSVTDPSPNALGVATCGTCGDKGWNRDWGTAGSVPSSVPSFFNFLRFWGGRI